MAKFKRPANDFWVTDLKSDLDVVRRHTAAGFESIPRDVVRLRLFILYDFLWTNGLMTQRLAARPEDVKPGTALHNRHLTDDGYYFLQKYLPRWQGRLYRHTTEAKERGFLARWYEQFAVSSRAETGAAVDRTGTRGRETHGRRATTSADD
ncbi:MAG TPA: hypothetical protein VKD90_05205 [Gemmataceae bacterium]|nr:hypothetical protein [Gemmataceae bacterium]